MSRACGAGVLAVALAFLAGWSGAQEGAVGYMPGVRGTEEGFQRWLEEFRPRAEASGIAPAVVTEALAGATFRPDVVDRDRRQNEFTRAIWDYLDRAVSEDRIAAGRAALERHAALFDRIEAAHGVDRTYVAAIWGLETAYGAVMGDVPVISALATLAHDGRRGAYFEAELLAALRLRQSGEAPAGEGWRGSWAGASGHGQFMPSVIERLAVDFDGDGRRDLWGESPEDALASTAAYLAANGWKEGQGWGFEVRLPPGFDWALAGDRTQRPMAFWAAQGLARADGAGLPPEGWAAVLLPAGHEGPALMIHDNFAAVETYNLADAYVIAVCHLADRLRGAGPFSASWPRHLRALTLADRIELQERLTRTGHSTAGVDGRIGPRSLHAIRAFQRARGLVPDGFASGALLDLLRTEQAGEGRR